MKKIVSIILFILIISVLVSVYAVGSTDIGVSCNFSKTSEDKVVMNYGLTYFADVAEGEVMVITMELDYDTSLISSVQAKGLENWSADFASETKKLVLETNSSKANTDVVELTFNINKSATMNSTNNKITIKNVNITNGDDLDKNVKDYTYEIPLNNEQETGNNTNTAGNNVNNNISQNSTEKNTSKTNLISGNLDKTVAKNQLPKAGLKNIAIIAIVVIAVAMVIFKIKSRKIKY